MSFISKKLSIPGVVLITPRVFYDKRGFFVEIYKYHEFKKMGIAEKWVQVNHSKSCQKTLRGLHYQKNPKAQAKLIQVVAGEVFDVCVDIRRGSPSFGKWIGVRLSAKNAKMLYIPKGFAHGFCVLSKEAEVIYYTSEVYSPEHERGMRFDDTRLSIDWPVKKPLLSKRDLSLPPLDEADNNFLYGKK